MFYAVRFREGPAVAKSNDSGRSANIPVSFVTATFANNLHRGHREPLRCANQRKNSRQCHSCLKPTQLPTILSIPCCAWTSNPCSCSRKRVSQLPRRKITANELITSTNVMARQVFSCLPSRCQAFDKQRQGNVERKRTERLRSQDCWIPVTAIARRSRSF